MDRRTTFALLLCLLVFAAFTAMQMRFAPKPVPKPAESTTAPAPGTASSPATPAAPAPSAGAPAVQPGSASLAPATPAVAEREVVLETPLYRATFSNIGARLQNLEARRQTQPQLEPAPVDAAHLPMPARACIAPLAARKSSHAAECHANSR